MRKIRRKLQSRRICLWWYIKNCWPEVVCWHSWPQVVDTPLIKWSFAKCYSRSRAHTVIWQKCFCLYTSHKREWKLSVADEQATLNTTRSVKAEVCKRCALQYQYLQLTLISFLMLINIEKESEKAISVVRNCCCNSNKFLGFITACKNKVGESAEFTHSQVLICPCRFSYFDNLILLLHQLNHIHFKTNIELVMHFKKSWR